MKGHSIFSIVSLYCSFIFQLSRLTLQSQTVPFHCDDVTVATTGRVSPSNQQESLLAHYQEELGEVRTQLDQKLHEVEALHGELASLRAEQEGTKKELDDQRRMLQATHQQRNELDQEVQYTRTRTPASRGSLHTSQISHLLSLWLLVPGLSSQFLFL